MKIDGGCSSPRDERGVIVVIFAMIIVVTVIMVALVVDHSRETFALGHLRRAADIAALTAVKRYNGRLNGWQDAKKAAILSVKHNTIQGANMSGVQDLILDEGQASQWPDSPHTGTTGTAGGITVTVERGVYWWDPDLDSNPSAPGNEGGFSFISLEDRKQFNGVNTFLIANATRVKVKLNRLLTTAFGRFAGLLSIDDLEKTSLAVTDPSETRVVLPLAIPACRLLQNTNRADIASLPNNDDAYYTNEYYPSQMCKERLLATEANPYGDLATYPGSPTGTGGTQSRREGLTRLESFFAYKFTNYSGDARPCSGASITGPAIDCMVLQPINATLGVVADSPGQVATGAQVAAAFSSTPMAASLGQYFAPLHYLDGAQGFTTAQVDSIVNRIKNSPLTVQSEFTTSHPTLGWQGKDNFPEVKRLKAAAGADWTNLPDFPDDPSGHLKIFWASDTSGAGSLTQIMDRQALNPDDFTLLGPPYDTRLASNTRPIITNPMCHDPGLNMDSLSGPVLKGLIPIITSTVPGYSLCDIKSVFRGEKQNAYPPVAGLKPRIVGFISVLLYDVCLKNLTAMFPTTQGTYQLDYGDFEITVDMTTTPTFTVGTNVVTDRNPGALDLEGVQALQPAREKVTKYEEDFNNYASCDHPSECDHGPPDRLAFGVEDDMLKCWDFRSIFEAARDLNIFSCAAGEDPDDCDWPSEYLLGEKRKIRLLKELLDGVVLANPGTHCLPIRKLNGYNPALASSWEDPLYSLAAGPYGGGGIAGALECNGDPDSGNPVMWGTGGYWEDTRPTLVSDDATDAQP